MGVENAVPRGDIRGFRRFFKDDLVSGFLVFLIALPLCLGISLACGYPAIAGVFTAIIGALVTTFISDSELTIKGPAAGLIVIAIGTIEQFGGDGTVGGFTAADQSAYRAALAVGVAAAVLQIVFGIVRAGILVEFFPVSAVHGMLAAIGVIIVLKQLPVTLGVEAQGEPLELLKEIPHFVREMNPAVALIGGVSLVIMFGWPLLKQRVLRAVPAPLVVLLVSVPMGMVLDLSHDHVYMFGGHEYALGEKYLVSMPDRVFGMFDEITTPDFSVLSQPVAWKWVLMFFIIGSLESLLSAKAIDLIDPWKRKTDFNKDMLAVGVANLLSAAVGGLPMISEIVRSKANIDNGARTRFADMWHGVFLLVCVALIPTILHRIPLAALAAMLVYTGFRLAHPTEFRHVLEIGREQLAIFVVTLVAVLATDLLIGIGIGIVFKVGIHMANGVPFRSLLRPLLEYEVRKDGSVVILARGSAVFTNWIPLRRQIEKIGLVEGHDIVLDLSGVALVDHSVMEKLHELQAEFGLEGRSLRLLGLEALENRMSDHAFAARKPGLAAFRRVTLVAEEKVVDTILPAFLGLGASGYTAIPCEGSGRSRLERTEGGVAARPVPCTRLELVVPPEVCERMIAHLRDRYGPLDHITTAIETVEVVRPEQFLPQEVEP